MTKAQSECTICQAEIGDPVPQRGWVWEDGYWRLTLLSNWFVSGILLIHLLLLTSCGHLTSTSAQVTPTPQPAPVASDLALRTLVTRILDNRFPASHSEAIPESPELLVSEGRM